MAFDCADTAIVMTDADMRIVTANAAYAKLTGFSSSQLVGTLLPVAKPCGEASGCMRGRIQCAHRDGRVSPVWMNLTVVTDSDGTVQGHVVTFTDISVLEAEHEALRHWAQHDPLTELPNRRLFGTELERCVTRARRHAQRFGLLFLDIDRFKCINDTLGHDAGDALLQEVAHRLRKTVRAEDLVARWGGDEFVVALDSLSHPVDAATTAVTLQQEIGRLIDVPGHRLSVSASIGIAMFPDDASTSSDLIRAADTAMYVAKRCGPGHFAFCQPMHLPCSA